MTGAAVWFLGLKIVRLYFIILLLYYLLGWIVVEQLQIISVMIFVKDAVKRVLFFEVWKKTLQLLP